MPDNKQQILAMMQARLAAQKKAEPAKHKAVAPPKPPQAPAKEEPEPKPVLARIVVTEPNLRLSRAIAAALEAERLQVLAAATVPETIRHVESAAPAAIVLAEAIGPIDASVVCEKIRALPGCLELPILVMVESVNRAIRDRVFNAGANAMMPRPILMPDLIQKVKQLIRYDDLQGKAP